MISRREINRRYYQRHKKKILENQREYYKNNPEKRKAAWRKYNEANKEMINEKNKANYRRKREYYLKYAHSKEQRDRNNARTRAKGVMKRESRERF